MELIKSKTKRFIISFAMTFLVITALFTGATAQTRLLGVAHNASGLSAVFDELMPAQMNNLHIPGGVISVVQNGQLVFARGYGYADVDERRPVAADKTLFRLASVSKLFVWTVVMQLVEQGKIDLQADINTYLHEFKIPPTYPEPVTMLDLMNHTAGFEERPLGTSVRDQQDIQPLGEYLAEHIPARVRPPGVLTAYSNFGAALAGYIVGQIAGMPFDQYVEEQIFAQLEMQRSTFRQPLPSGLAPDLALGYTHVNGVYEPQDPEWMQLAPAASLSATATDMANFMIAHLQNGLFGQARILGEDTVVEMHQQSFTNDPRVSGYAHGFSEATINGRRVLGHTGDILYFHSGLFLLPDENTGIFIAFNGANGMVAVLNTLRALMDQIYPDRTPVPSMTTGIDIGIGRYAGTYLPTRGEFTTAGKMVQMFQSIQVTAQGDHQLVVSLGFPAQFVWRYVEVVPGVFRSMDIPPSIFGDVVFRSDDQGRMHYLFQQNNPSTVYIKAPWYVEPMLNLAFLGITVILFMSVIFWAPVGWWIRRRYLEQCAFLSRLATWWEALLSLTGLLFLAGFITIFSNPQTVFGLSPMARSLFLLPLMVAVLAIGMFVFTILAWARRWWSFPGRVHYTLVTLSALAFVWWLAYWKLWIGYLQ